MDLTYRTLFIFVVTAIACHLSCATDLFKVPIQEAQMVPSYEEMASKIHRLKSELYLNYSKQVGEDKELGPPKGSNVSRHPFFGYIEVVTQVTAWILPSRIVKVDIEQQSLTLILYEVFFWRDLSLQWDRNLDHIPVEELTLDASKIWTPNIFPVNSLEKAELMDPGLVEVDFDGLCTLQRTTQYTIPCMVKIQNFPFDVHNCSLTYSQLGNLHHKMKIKPLEPELFSYSIRVGDDELFGEDRFAHLEWNIERSHTKPKANGYKLNFSILLNRQSRFYATVLIFPVVLLNILSLVVFTLPINTTERENFALSLILTYFVSMMIILEESPPTGDQMPYLGIYVILCTAVVLVNFGMSLILIEINEHFRLKQVQMPRFLSLILQKCFSLDERFRLYCEKKRHLLSPENKDLKEEVRTSKYQKEAFKWKLLCKILNIVFFVVTVFAHILLSSFLIIGL